MSLRLSNELAAVIGDGHFAPPTHATSGPCCMTPQAIEQLVDAILAAGYRKVDEEQA